MPLQKQNVPLSLNQGLNTKVDPKQQPFGSFTRLENITFDKEEEFNKRNGYDEIPSKGIGNISLESVIGIGKFKSQPLWISKDQVYSYAESSNVWNSEGSYDSVVPESKIIVQDGKEQECLDCGYLNGYQIFGYVDSGYFKLSVLDEKTDAFVVYNQAIPNIPSGTNTISKVKVEVFNNSIFTFFVETNAAGTAATLLYKEFDLSGYISDGLTLTSGTALQPDAGNAFGASQTVKTVEISTGNGLYDVCAVDNKLLIGYHDDTANELKFKYIAADAAMALSGEIDPFTTAIVPLNALDMVSTPLKTISVTAIDNANLVKFGFVSNTASRVRDAVTIEDISSTGTATNAVGGTNVTSASSDGLEIKIFYQVNQTNPYLYDITAGTSAASTVATDRYTWNMPFIRKSSYNVTTSTVGTASDVARGVGLASKAFVQDINIYLNVIRETFLNATYYTMKSDGSVQSKISPGTAGAMLGTIRKKADLSTGYYNYDGSSNPNAIYRIASLSRVPQITTEKFLFVNSRQGKILSGTDGATSFFSLYGVNSSVINFSNTITNQTEELGENLNFAGGQLKAYDGNVLVEQNFNYPPDVTIATRGTIVSTASPTFPKPGTGVTNVYSYKAIFTWADAQGNVHKSAVSTETSVEVEDTDFTVSETGFNSFLVKIPTIDLTQKSNVYLELYRTAANGSIFYRCNGDNEITVDQTFEPIINTGSVDLVSFIDAASDTSISSNELLYTTGGVLENHSPPANSITGSFKNRLFLAGLENKLEVRYSKILREKIGIEFNETLSILISQLGGDIVALKGMDDKLIIFKENAIFFLSGDGPNNLGQQDTFSKPQLISADVGCSNKNSLVLAPQGLFFKSNKGIYMLSRSLGLQYVGAPMNDFNHLDITKADMLAKTNELRFLTSDGECLVYNYYRGYWTTFMNHRGEGSVVIGDSYYYVHKNPQGNQLFKQNYDSYDDAGVPINMALETGWMNPVAAQNAIRVYRMLLLGDYFTPHKIKVSVAYDYDDTFVDFSTIAVTDYTQIYAFGDPGVKDTPTGMAKGYYGDPGGTTGSYTTAIAYGGKDVMQYQIRVDFSKQKCEAIKLRIETLQDAGQLGRGVNLSQLLFVAGSKGTDYKIKQSRIFTTGTNT